MEIPLLNIVENITDLKAKPIGGYVLLSAKTTPGDNLGGFYRWDDAASGAEDTVYMNTVPSDNSATGRWIRVFQKATVYGPGIMVRNGGMKTLYTPGTSDASGIVTVYLTDTGLSSGTALFTEVWVTQCDATANAATANDAITVSKKSISGDLKTLTYTLARGNSQVLSILGVTVAGMRAAPAGIPCQLRIDGI